MDDFETLFQIAVQGLSALPEHQRQWIRPRVGLSCLLCNNAGHSAGGRYVYDAPANFLNHLQWHTLPKPELPEEQAPADTGHNESDFSCSNDSYATSSSSSSLDNSKQEVEVVVVVVEEEGDEEVEMVAEEGDEEVEMVAEVGRNPGEIVEEAVGGGTPFVRLTATIQEALDALPTMTSWLRVLTEIQVALDSVQSANAIQTEISARIRATQNLTKRLGLLNLLA